MPRVHVADDNVIPVKKTRVIQINEHTSISVRRVEKGNSKSPTKTLKIDFDNISFNENTIKANNEQNKNNVFMFSLIFYVGAFLLGCLCLMFVPSNNIAIQGIANQYKNEKPHIITLETEHPAVLDICNYLKKENLSITKLPVNKDGILNIEKFKTPAHHLRL